MNPTLGILLPRSIKRAFMVDLEPHVASLLRKHDLAISVNKTSLTITEGEPSLNDPSVETLANGLTSSSMHQKVTLHSSIGEIKVLNEITEEFKPKAYTCKNDKEYTIVETRVATIRLHTPANVGSVENGEDLLVLQLQFIDRDIPTISVYMDLSDDELYVMEGF